MKTGEGKTLVATLPAYLNALSGAGVHIVSSGAGAVRCGDFAHALKKGDYFFLPACAAGEAIVEGELELLICRGGIEP